MERSNNKIFIHAEGDSSVGDNGFEAIISLEDRDGALDDDKDALMSFLKEKIKEYFEDHDYVTHVHTEKEMDDMIHYAEQLNEHD